MCRILLKIGTGRAPCQVDAGLVLAIALHLECGDITVSACVPETTYTASINMYSTPPLWYWVSSKRGLSQNYLYKIFKCYCSIGMDTTIQLHTQADMHNHVHKCTCMYSCMYSHSHTHTGKHTYIHTCAHKHTHM